MPMPNNRANIVLLCLVAAAHVFIFSAAFPFYSVVDEQMHVDLAIKYSQGKIPKSLVSADAEVGPYLAIFGSPEFLQTNGATPAPAWKQPIESVRDRLAAKEFFFANTFQNHESSQPPIYYAAAGIWWRLGKILHFDGLALLYWLRFLNVVFIVALAWLGWLASRKIFPENNFVQFAVPAFIALLPQSTFYAVNNDIAAPLAFGAAFLLLLKFWEAEIPSVKLAAATGVFLAATFLTKISNLPLLAVAGVFLVWKIWGITLKQKFRAASFSFLVLILCAGLPMAAWMFWCKNNFGDLTGSALKIKFLNWTEQPFAAWLHHPIFTAQGFWFFLKGNLASFWFGEQLWHRPPLANGDANSVVIVFSLGMLALVSVALLWPRSGFTTQQKTALSLGFACFFAMLMFFALLSVKYDFQDCFYPSREKPFFVSGRLMLGILIPFLILFCAGLDRLMKNFQATTKFFVLFVLLGFLLVSEISTDWPVFASGYNWFHN
jgi:Predicted membrane protein (DUF2142)